MKKLEIEGLNNEAPHNGDARNEQDENITFSSKLVDYFSLQVKVFKESSKDTLTVNQLKKVYCHAAREGRAQEAENLNLHGLARVHMFLRLKSGGKMAIKPDSPKDTKATELELEEPQKIIRLSNFIDISESWIPSDEDFDKAQKEMDENDLKHEYDNIEDLYLEYEPIEQKWD
jgi:hypothetical protein